VCQCVEIADRLWPVGGGDRASKEQKGKCYLGWGYIAPDGAHGTVCGFVMNIPLRWSWLALAWVIGDIPILTKIMLRFVFWLGRYRSYGAAR
jgi:hypothetical protein